MTDPFKTRLRRGDRLIGAIVSLPSPEIAEALSLCGFDWLFIDMEHGGLDVAALGNLLRAAQPRTPCAVRIPAIDEVWIKRCLDAGADGVIAPQIKTAEDAQRVVRWSKYPPQGERSVGIARAQGYGMNFADYVARANDDIAVILQIEHIDAVGRIDSILGVDGIDAIFVGPYDLSASMGKIGKVDDPDARDAIDRVRGSAQAKGVSLGIFTADAAAAPPFLEAGFTLMAVGIDAALLASAGRGILDALR